MIISLKEQARNNHSSKQRLKPAAKILAQPPRRETHPATIIRRASLDLQSLTQSDVLQLQRAIGNRAARRCLAQMSSRLFAGKKPETGLPDDLQASVENIAGISLDRVKVHYNSALPAQLNALAFTIGQDIHLGPGQQEHLPHEAWHVVQQMQGRVKPTLQAQGMPINEDAGLEHEADMMGARALQARQPDLSIGAVGQARAGDAVASGVSLAPGRVVQLKPPALPGARRDIGLYFLGRNPTISFINKALELDPDEVVGRPHSNVPLTHHTLTVFDSGNAAVVSKQSEEAFITIDVADLSALADGEYWVRGVATTQAGNTYYDEFVINVATRVPEGGSALPHPIVGSGYLGSHWTSTAYEHSFMQQGIQTRGTSQARFGEGLYLTRDRGYGWKAGLSKIQEVRGGHVGEWGVYLRPGETFEGAMDGTKIQGQFTDPPWLGTELAAYINNYDIIYDNHEKEIKINPRAFAKVNLVSMGEYHPLTGERL